MDELISRTLSEQCLAQDEPLEVFPLVDGFVPARYSHPALLSILITSLPRRLQPQWALLPSRALASAGSLGSALPLLSPKASVSAFAR